jgi:hypothetical protein
MVKRKARRAGQLAWPFGIEKNALKSVFAAKTRSNQSSRLKIAAL